MYGSLHFKVLILLFKLNHFPSDKHILVLQCHMRCPWIFCLIPSRSGYLIGMCSFPAFPHVLDILGILEYLGGQSWSVRAYLGIYGKAANTASCFPSSGLKLQDWWTLEHDPCHWPWSAPDFPRERQSWCSTLQNHTPQSKCITPHL